MRLRCFGQLALTLIADVSGNQRVIQKNTDLASAPGERVHKVSADQAGLRVVPAAHGAFTAHGFVGVEEGAIGFHRHLALNFHEFPSGKLQSTVTASVALRGRHVPISGRVFANGRVMAYFEDKWVGWNPGEGGVQYLREPGAIGAVVSDDTGKAFDTVTWDPAKGLVVHTWELK